ncbi:MAG: toll/interleukin-1 receptor domain-containing protein, partial [Pseudomonadota bacterium]
MSWLEELYEQLRTVPLGKKPANLLRTILELAPSPSSTGNIVSVPQSAVVDQLTQLEGKTPSDDTLRRRVSEINKAAYSLIDHYNDEPPFTVRSQKPNFQVEFQPTLFKSSEARTAIADSTEYDIANASQDFLQDPLVDKEWQVFISHSWDQDPHIEAALDRFVGKLKYSLHTLPHKWSKRFGSINLWFDRNNMHGGEQFEAQTDPACQQSQVAIFILSNSWYHSSACKRERGFFCDKQGKPNPNKVLRIQLSGNFKDNPPEISSGPIFPIHWNNNYSNLLTLDNNGNASEIDDYIHRLTREICEMLERQLAGQASHGAIRVTPEKNTDHKHFLEQTNEFEEVVQEG